MPSIPPRVRAGMRIVAIVTGLAVACISLFIGGALVTGDSPPVLEIVMGVEAQTVCSDVFVSDIEPTCGFGTDVIDSAHRRVTSTWLGVSRTAVYRPGLGCTLVPVIGHTGDPPDEADIRAQPLPDFHPPALPLPGPWPVGDVVPNEPFPEEIDEMKLEAALDWAFMEAQGTPTSAVIVVYQDRLIAERYRDGYSQSSRHASASAAKSFMNAFIGVLVEQGKLDIRAPAPIPEWRAPGDPRREITLDQLLRMSSGLAWNEVYVSPGNLARYPMAYFYDRHSEIHDVMNILRIDNIAGLARSKPPAFEPDTAWYYSSGTSNILASIVRDTVGGSLEEYFNFPRDDFFDRIGMRTAIITPDASGTFIGSSYVYATAREWARFGLVYLNGGVWNGARILPVGWAAYSRTPTRAPAPPVAVPGWRATRPYGAQFWLNAPHPVTGEAPPFPDLPHDLYMAAGYGGQMVYIIPSRDMVIVRLGRILLEPYVPWEGEEFLTQILGAIPADESGG